MTQETRMLFTEGREMMLAFHHMPRANGTKYRGNVIPTQADIRQLAKQLDLTYSFVARRIWAFLEN